MPLRTFKQCAAEWVDAVRHGITKTITFHLSHHDDDRLRHLVVEERTTEKALIEEAVADLLKKRGVSDWFPPEIS